MTAYRCLFFLAGLLGIALSLLLLTILGEFSAGFGWKFTLILGVLAVGGLLVGLQSLVVAARLRGLLAAKPRFVYRTIFLNLVFSILMLFIPGLNIVAIPAFFLCIWLRLHLAHLSEVETVRHAQVRPLGFSGPPN